MFEFKERGTYQIPPDVDLQQMNVPGATPQERSAKYEPTPTKTPLVFKGMYVRMCVCVCVSMCVCVCVCVCIYIYSRRRGEYMYIYIHIYIYNCIYNVCMYIYAYIRVLLHFLFVAVGEKNFGRLNIHTRNTNGITALTYTSILCHRHTGSRRRGENACDCRREQYI